MAEGISSFPAFLLSNIKQAPDLVIRPGQVLFGITLEAVAGRAVLLLQGVNVVAELETALTPGEKVALQVAELTPGGKILLKKLDWGENKSGQEISGQELKTVLQHFGLQEGKFNRSLVKEKGIEISLKHALLKLTQSPELKSTSALMETAREMLKEITGLQWLNISGQQEAAESSSTFLAAWASFPEEKLLPLFLKIKKYNQHRNDAETPSYQIFFLLNTRHLGQIVCRLALEEKHLTCSFTVRGKKEKKITDNYLGVLKQKLEHLPWQIIIHPTKISSSGGIKRSWQEEFFAGDPGRVKMLDTRV